MAAPAASPGDDVGIDVDLIKVLASDTRRDLLRLLGGRRHTLTELAEALDLKKATILEHLGKLVEAGLIRKLDDGERLWVYYELTWRGRRIVHPERTRFYLILAGSAAALVLVGAIVTATSMLGGLPAPASDDQAAGAPDGMLMQERATGAPIIVWRGLDESVAIPLTGPAPAGSTLLVDDPAGRLELAVVDARASLGADEVDRLSLGRHALSLRTDAGDLPLAMLLDVRTPPVALAPLAIPEGQASTLVLSVGVPGLPVPTDLAVRVDGVLVPVSELGRERTFTLTPTGPGEIDVRVGRLSSASVLVLPDLRAEARDDNGTLVLTLSDARGPLDNATAALDGLDLGAADANGTLRAAWPQAGDHVLAIRAADGRAREIAVGISPGSFAPLPPRLALTAYSDPGARSLSAHVEVANLGLANESVTLLARLDGQTIASARVDVPAGSRAETLLAADVPLASPVTIEAYGAWPVSVSTRSLGGRETASTDATANAPTASGTPTPAAPTPAAAGENWSVTEQDADGTRNVAFYSASSIGRGPDATTTLYPPPSAATAPTMVGERAAPAVPFVSPVAVMVGLALLALLVRRAGSKRR